MKIGVDGGGTKTELMLLGRAGEVCARQLAPGCNPSVIGPEAARVQLQSALAALLLAAEVQNGGPVRIQRTLLCMAGAPTFWTETAAWLQETGDFGDVAAMDDSRPVLALATQGRPGLVLHGGTGSFIAAQAPDGTIGYAGGLGWRFGDAGSGFDLGRRAIAQALLEAQGWQRETSVGRLVTAQAGLATAPELTRFFYTHTEPNRVIAALAPGILRLAEEGEAAAAQLVLASVGELLQLAERVTTKWFAGWDLDLLPAAVSGPILTHPAVRPVLVSRSSLSLRVLNAPPIEGVRLLLSKL